MCGNNDRKSDEVQIEKCNMAYFGSADFGNSDVCLYKEMGANRASYGYSPRGVSYCVLFSREDMVKSHQAKKYDVAFDT